MHGRSGIQSDKNDKPYYMRQKRHEHPRPERTRHINEDKGKNYNPEANMKRMTGHPDIF